jgi:hypothetical protein
MRYQLPHRLVAFAILAISLTQFYLTAQPSVPFWDPGELTAAAYMLQVPHPPGGPLFLIVGRVFTMLPIHDSIGFRVNLVSVVTSAFAVMFLYLIAVRLINNYRRKSPDSMWEAVATYGAAAAGALTFSFSDTFWFNAVESNYFAASTLLFSMITWSMLVWYDRADEPGSGKYLVLIGYLVGLSAGVHLMSVPSIVAAGMLVTFKRYVEDEAMCRRSAILFVIHAAIILVVAIGMYSALTGQTPPSYEDAKAFDARFMIITGVISLLFVAIFWRRVVNRSSFYFPVLVGGVVLFFAYPGVVKLLPKLLHATAGNSTGAGLVVLILILAGLGILAYWLAKRRLGLFQTGVVALIAAVIGFTTYTTIVIRSNQNPPMNENQPKTFDGLLTYLNREQYGDFPIFKRRWSTEGRHKFTWTNYRSDLDFFWRYQIDHMYNRYLFWNFIGREGHEQDAGVSWKDYFGIPFIVGLLGLYFHFRNNWRMASVFLILFVIMGYLIAFYQNQQDMQPRDRDYFYCGSYFIFSIWIALGIRGLIDLAQQKVKNVGMVNGLTLGVLAVGLVIIPGRLFQVNYPTHDRSRNWVPWDFAYNILQSCVPNSILFTNGDNDTFPLWYLQDVEGVRRDIRIVNLSLVNTPWYIRQLKHDEPYGTPKVKISFDDAEIDRIGMVPWQTQTRKIPVPPEVAREYGVKDSSVLANGYLTYTMPSTMQFGNVKAIRVQDVMVMDIVERNVWERPIYFAVTCGEDTKNGLGDYLKMEGLAARLVPQKKTVEPGVDYVDETMMRKELLEDSAGYSTSYRPGFLYRGLNDPKVFLDENMQMMTRNYRTSYIRLALYYLYSAHDNAMATKTLDRMEQVIPRSVQAMDYRMMFDLFNLYRAAGATEQWRALSIENESAALEQLKRNPNDYTSYYNPYRVLMEIYDRTGQYSKAADLLEGLTKVLPRNQQQQLSNEIQRYRGLAAASDSNARGKANQ